MRGCVRLARPTILGAALHIHWSAFVAGGLLFACLARQPAHAALLALSYFGMILLHEAGHALVASRLGYRPVAILLSFVHGLCVFERPGNARHVALIAWGGALAQLAVATPLILLAQFTPLGANSYFGVLVAVFGYLSVMIAALNLAPVRGLDGALAWRLFPLLFR